jgi:hypothetical protein
MGRKLKHFQTNKIGRNLLPLNLSLGRNAKRSHSNLNEGRLDQPQNLMKI